MNWLGYRVFCLRLWWLELPHKLAWWLAWAIPRRVALYAFLRVYTATVTELSWDAEDIYGKCYEGWQKGNGR